MSNNWSPKMYVGILVGTLLLTLSIVGYSYAGAELPPGTKVIDRPNKDLQGYLIASYDAAQNKMTGMIVGVCRGLQFSMGPDVRTPIQSFADDTSQEELEGFFVRVSDYPPGAFDVPKRCFSGRKEQDTLIGFTIDTVEEFVVKTPLLVIAKVVILGVIPQ